MPDILEKVLSGDVRTVARLISDIDDNIPGVRDILKELYPHTGKASIIGITGAPGVGKSTLVDRMVGQLREKKLKIAILAIDPSSPFTGGSILGDRIRMQRHSSDKDVYIRSLATRGCFGGLTQSTRSVIDVLDAMGNDIIIIETVGVGQDEVDIVKNAHTTAVVVIPGMGDDIQAIKAGILEVGDIFIVNKADREGSDNTYNDLRLMIEISKKNDEDGTWTAPIIKTVANAGKGIEDLLKEIQRHTEYLKGPSGGLLPHVSRGRVKEELSELLKGHLIKEVFSNLTESNEFEKAVESILAGKLDPYSASEELVNLCFNNSKP